MGLTGELERSRQIRSMLEDVISDPSRLGPDRRRPGPAGGPGAPGVVVSAPAQVAVRLAAFICCL